MAPLQITIPSTQTVDAPSHGKPYTEYEIRIAHPFPRTTTILRKRYSDFAALDTALRSQVSAAPPVPLPAKSWLGGSLGKLGLGSTLGSPEQIEKRREGLEKYLTAIETTDDARWRVSAAYRDFLQLKDRDDRQTQSLPGAQFGQDRVRDSSDWLDKFADVKRNLQDARVWLTRREQATVATAQHEASANAKKGLVRAGTLLSALDEGLERLSGKGNDDWEAEKLGDGEARRRRDMISTARKERDGLESVLNIMAMKSAVAGSGSSTPSTSSAAVTNEQKAALFKGVNSRPKSGRRVLGETDQTRELDNEEILQLQKRIIRGQDEGVEQLTQDVRKIGQIAMEIRNAVSGDNVDLGELNEDVDRVDAKMKIAKKRINRIK